MRKMRCQNMPNYAQNISVGKSGMVPRLRYLIPFVLLFSKMTQETPEFKYFILSKSDQSIVSL